MGRSFKEEFTFEERCEDSRDIVAKYPDRLPVVKVRLQKDGTHPQPIFPFFHCQIFLNRWIFKHFHSHQTRALCMVVVERYSKTDLPDMEKKKYLVPRDMSVGLFIHILSSRLQLAPGKALFVFVKNTLPQTSSLMETVYESFKDEDGYLYMCYSSEKTFGYANIQTCELYSM